MAEDTDRLYRKSIRFRRDLRLAAQPGAISCGNRRKSNTHTKSRQRVVPLPFLWYDKQITKHMEDYYEENCRRKKILRSI